MAWSKIASLAILSVEVYGMLKIASVCWNCFGFLLLLSLLLLLSWARRRVKDFDLLVDIYPGTFLFTTSDDSILLDLIWVRNVLLEVSVDIVVKPFTIVIINKRKQ
jgi:hypothetical protein